MLIYKMAKIAILYVDKVNFRPIIQQLNVKWSCRSDGALAVAENEQLDATHSRKWLPVARAIKSGANVGAVTYEIEKTLCRQLRRLTKDGHLPEMICALDDHQKMRRLCQDWQGHPAVGWAFQEAAEQSGPTSEKMRYALRQVLDISLDDVPVLAAEGANSVNVTQARDTLSRARGQFDEEPLTRIAEKLVANPEWSAKARRQSSSPSFDFASTESMLSDSLLSRN